jgi:hypothetical protein
METVAEENPLRSATSRMVTAAGCERLREGSDLPWDFVDEAVRAGFESEDSMGSLNLASCWRTLQDDESSVKRVLVRMGREQEGREELTSATKMLNEQRAARYKELEEETVPSPELARWPQ